MKKVILVIILISLLLTTTKVNAYTSDKFKIQSQGDSFHVRTIIAGEYTYSTFKSIRRFSDNHNAFGIEPQKAINGDLVITPLENNFFNYLNMSKETWERVQLLAYHGQNCYNNYGNITYYFAAQLLIYNAIDPAGERVFVNKTTKEVNHNFDNAINELNGLVDNSLKVPDLDFSGDFYVLEKQTLIDKNNILDDFDLIYNKELINVEVNDDELVITALKEGKVEIELIKKNTTVNNTLFYNYEDYQSLIIPLGAYPVSKKIEFNILAKETTNLKIELNNDNSNTIIIDSTEEVEIIDENIKNINLENKDIFITLPNTSE